jgi:hypothetical protein
MYQTGLLTDGAVRAGWIEERAARERLTVHPLSRALSPGRHVGAERL